MTKEEASARYRIPIKILDEYESWGLCDVVKQVMGVWQYDDTDIERLDLIMTLHDIGFSHEEVKRYMQLSLQEGSSDPIRLKMLEQLRCKALDEIHFKERQLAWMDELRNEIEKGRKEDA